MTRLTLADFSAVTDIEVYTTAELWHNAVCEPPHLRFTPCILCRIRDEVTTLAMDELRARSAGLKPHIPGAP